MIPSSNSLKTPNSSLAINFDHLLTEIDEYANSLNQDKTPPFPSTVTTFSSDSNEEPASSDFSTTPPNFTDLKPSTPSRNASLTRPPSAKTYRFRSPKSHTHSPLKLSTTPPTTFNATTLGHSSINTITYSSESVSPTPTRKLSLTSQPSALSTKSSTLEPKVFPITIDTSQRDSSTRRHSRPSIPNVSDVNSIRGPSFHLNTFSQKTDPSPDSKDSTLPHDPDTESDSEVLELKRFSPMTTPASEHGLSPNIGLDPPVSSTSVPLVNSNAKSQRTAASPLHSSTSHTSSTKELNLTFRTSTQQQHASASPATTTSTSSSGTKPKLYQARPLPPLPISSPTSSVPPPPPPPITIPTSPNATSPKSPKSPKHKKTKLSPTSPHPAHSVHVPPPVISQAPPPIPSRPPPLSVIIESKQLSYMEMEEDEVDMVDFYENVKVLQPEGTMDIVEPQDKENSMFDAEWEQPVHEEFQQTSLNLSSSSSSSLLHKKNSNLSLESSTLDGLVHSSSSSSSSVAIPPSHRSSPPPSRPSSITNTSRSSVSTTSSFAKSDTDSSSSRSSYSSSESSNSSSSGQVHSSQASFAAPSFKPTQVSTASTSSSSSSSSSTLQFEDMDSRDLLDLDGLVQELDHLLETGKYNHKRLSNLVAPSPTHQLLEHRQRKFEVNQLEKQAQSSGLDPKDPKVKLALDKLAKAQIQKVATRIYIHDATNFRTVYLTSFTTAEMVVDLVLGKHRKHLSPLVSDPLNSSSSSSSSSSTSSSSSSQAKGTWVLFELFNDLGIERPFKDWELVTHVLKSWEHQTRNALLLRKYNYHHSLSLNSLKQYYPPVQGPLYMETKKGSFKKYQFELNPEQYALYIRKKDLSAPELVCTLFEHDVYTAISSRKKQPTSYLFALKSVSKMSMFEDVNQGYVYFFCAETVEQMKEWVLALRNVKGHADEVAHPEWFDDEGLILKGVVPTSQTMTSHTKSPLLSFNTEETKSLPRTKDKLNTSTKEKASTITSTTSSFSMTSGNGIGFTSPLLNRPRLLDSTISQTPKEGLGGKGTLFDQIDKKKESQKSAFETLRSASSKHGQRKNLIDLIPDT